MNAPSAAAAPKTPPNAGGFVDCDIHPAFKSRADLDQFLSKRWREHRATIGGRPRQPYTSRTAFPRFTPEDGMRLDAWPDGGGPPGSDVEFMRKQHLDHYGIRYGVLLPLLGGAFDERNLDYAAALATAINDWQAACWLDREPRLRASIVVQPDDPDSAVAEIERRAKDRRFVQVMLVLRMTEPVGRKRYRRILEAAAANGLPVALHLGGSNGHASTASGWPSYYYEEHHSYVQSAEAVVSSLVVEGAFERSPDLKVVMVEGSMAFLPPLSWRLDNHWKRLKAEVPHLTRAPSEYIRDHVWMTTQPIDEPERPADILTVLEWIGWDRVMTATDYPHWDEDDPRYSMRVPLPKPEGAKVLFENALKLYNLE